MDGYKTARYFFWRHEEVVAAFVSFKSRLGAAIALHIQQGENPTEWLSERAPEPHDIYRPFFSTSFISRWIGNFVVIITCIVLTIFLFISVALVQSLTHLDQLETWFPFLKGILQITFISQVITGYLPSLILKMFLSFVPPVMTALSSIQGYNALSQIERSACNKVLWFMIWNIFFANSLSGSVLYRVNIFLEPKEIPNTLAVAVPGQMLDIKPQNLAHKTRPGVENGSSKLATPSVAKSQKQERKSEDGLVKQRPKMTLTKPEEPEFETSQRVRSINVFAVSKK